MSELHVRKVRDVETGGRPTPLEDPFYLMMNLSHTGFTDRIGKRALYQPITFPKVGQIMPIGLDFMDRSN